MFQAVNLSPSQEISFNELRSVPIKCLPAENLTAQLEEAVLAGLY